MLQAKPLASLSGGLLARKGAARPAMRPQGYASLAPTSQQLEDLGWDDMGTEPAAVEPAKPAVLVARAALVEAIAPASPEPEQEPLPVHPVSVATAGRLSRETAHAGRAAFTLRLDADRHLKLRLASALAHQSAQALVAQALDRFLATVPEVHALVAQLPPQKLARTPKRAPAKGKRS